jgi:hypothetical protein
MGRKVKITPEVIARSRGSESAKKALAEWIGDGTATFDGKTMIMVMAPAEKSFRVLDLRNGEFAAEVKAKPQAGHVSEEVLILARRICSWTKKGYLRTQTYRKKSSPW